MSKNYLTDLDAEFQDSKTFKDYLRLIRNNLTIVILIILASLAIAVIYAINAKDYYRSGTALKVTKPGGSILQSPLMPEFTDWGNDRFIANEIEIMKSYNLRERVARLLVDTLVKEKTTDENSILRRNDFNSEDNSLFTVPQIAGILNNIVDIGQKRGLDIVDITAESTSPKEAALIANLYAKEYKIFNLEINRDQLTFVKEFLDKQRAEKREQLNEAEELLRNYQEKGGIIALDQQAQSLIQQLAQFEAQKNAADIELLASNEILKKLKDELAAQDPRLADYLESATSESYITALQNQIAELQLNRDLALAKADPKVDISGTLKEYDKKISDLKSKLNEKVKVLKSGIMASSPEEVRSLSQKIIEEEIRNRSFKIQLNTLEGIVNRYEERFNKLPKTSIELARFQRNRESLEKLYTLVEEKYQEALINEQSQPGNVLIVDDGRIPNIPSKPNRFLIIMVGLLIGSGLAFGYVFLKEYFDNTIKTPEDIQRKNINVLAWIPHIDILGSNGSMKLDFIIANNPDSVPSEAYRALRTRVQFSRPDRENLKTILITSPAPQEGKTTVALNLAGSFAQANKKTLLIDCDLRKPRIHHVFDKRKEPGLIDYLVGEAKLEDIINAEKMKNLSYITSGTLPPNPAEMLDSKQMEDFLTEMRKIYDYVVLDSPPIIAVTDAEILAKKVDGSILVISAELTEEAMMTRAVDLLKHDNSLLIGTVLNNFSTKAGYGSYYKYYYYYSNILK